MFVFEVFYLLALFIYKIHRRKLLSGKAPDTPGKDIFLAEASGIMPGR